jgi:iron complex outermembrane recepter protein
MIQNSTSRSRAAKALRVAALSASCLVAVPAFAQDAAADETEVNSDGIGEITVTARKRVEDVQSVPIAVSAINGEALENRFVPDVRAVAKYIPNVQLGQVQFSGATLSASIRGLTFADIERSFEPAVATSIDGIFLASNTGALVDMFDVESIEVLRGPQGTLFGRNTIGGIINVKRTRPTGELGAKLSATIGSYGRKDFKAVLNAPIVKDVLALKVGVFSINGDAMTYNYTSGKRDPGLDRLGVTGTLLFTPTENFEALFTYEHIKDRSNYNQLVNQSLPTFDPDNDPDTANSIGGELACDGFALCYNGPLDPVNNPTGPTLQELYEDSDFRASFTDVPFQVPMNADNLTLNMKYSGENFDIVSVTGLWKNDDALDIDNIGHAVAPDTALFHPVRELHGKQFSQELRLDSNFDGMFNIVAGVYYFRSKYRLDIQNVYLLGGTQDPGTLVDTFSAGQTVKSYAAFAETYWKLSESTRVTIGGRYTKEKKAFNVQKPAVPANEGGPYFCPDPTSTYEPCQTGKLSFSKFTPRVSIDQQLADDVMVYASWSRGFRSGGWNGRPGSTPDTIGPYDPETVDSYELGLRSKFLDNRALFNLTVFQTNYNNKQEDEITQNPVLPTSTITFVRNASKARFRGVEAEAQFKPMADLHFFASAGYLKGKYLSFPGLGPDGSDADALPDVIDLRPFKNLRYAPKWNASLGTEWTIPVGSGDNRFQIGANVKYLDDYATEANKDRLGLAILGRGREIIPSHTSVDASISYFGEFEGASKYKISAFVNDAFHKGGRIVRSSAAAGVFWFSDRVPMRTWGLELQLDF